MRVRACDLAPDEILHFDVVLRHQVDRVFLLADAACARALDRVRAFEYECSRFARKICRESEDLLQFCRAEWARHATSVCVSNGGRAVGATVTMIR